jgi:hypothetical protein
MSTQYALCSTAKLSRVARRDMNLELTKEQRGKWYYNTKKRKRAPADDCPICLQPMDDPTKLKDMGCGHKHHEGCLADHLIKCTTRTCPVCRYKPHAGSDSDDDTYPYDSNHSSYSDRSDHSSYSDSSDFSEEDAIVQHIRTHMTQESKPHYRAILQHDYGVEIEPRATRYDIADEFYLHRLSRAQRLAKEESKPHYLAILELDYNIRLDPTTTYKEIVAELYYRTHVLYNDSDSSNVGASSSRN